MQFDCTAEDTLESTLTRCGGTSLKDLIGRTVDSQMFVELLARNNKVSFVREIDKKFKYRCESCMGVFHSAGEVQKHRDECYPTNVGSQLKPKPIQIQPKVHNQQ